MPESTSSSIFGRKRNDQGSWIDLGTAEIRFESRPPDGVKLTRDERIAKRMVEIAQQQTEIRHFGGHRHLG